MSEPTDNLAEADGRPWEEPGSCRMDCAPHRGPLLLMLGEISYWCGWAGFFVLLPSLVGLPIGVVAWLMSRRDLGRIAAGRMDPNGTDPSARAGDTAAVGIWLNVFALACWCLLGYLFYCLVSSLNFGG